MTLRGMRVRANGENVDWQMRPLGTRRTFYDSPLHCSFDDALHLPPRGGPPHLTVPLSASNVHLANFVRTLLRRLATEADPEDAEGAERGEHDDEGTADGVVHYLPRRRKRKRRRRRRSVLARLCNGTVIANDKNGDEDDDDDDDDRQPTTLSSFWNQSSCLRDVQTQIEDFVVGHCLPSDIRRVETCCDNDGGRRGICAVCVDGKPAPPLPPHSNYPVFAEQKKRWASS